MNKIRPRNVFVVEFNLGSHLSISQGGWNKQGGGAKGVKIINVEEGGYKRGH